MGKVLNDARCNLLFGVIYRHPGGNIDRFMEYLNSSIDKIHEENKLCVLMGDFNLDLLKFESHKDTDSFLNSMLSTFFLPQILQTTRITERDYSHFSESAFIEDCQSVNWEEVVHSSCDVSHMFESLYIKLSEIIDAHVLVKKISNNQLKLKSKPWITPAIKNSIQIKNKLYQTF